MELIRKVEAAIEKHQMLNIGEGVVVGISGGPDSACLLHVLHSLREKWKLTLMGVHVNHHLRGADADSDQALAERLCSDLGIACRTCHFDVKAMAKEQGLTTEEAGRKARYQAFFQAAEELAAAGLSARIAVAQNQDDQAETVLMRIMRGTGIEGLSGIEYSRSDGVIRPLLDVSRREIEDYCSDVGLRPCIDKTNLEPVYTRNRIRLELLPYMEQHFNPNVSGALTRLAAIAREEGSFLDSEAQKLMGLHAAVPSPAECPAGSSAVEFPLDVFRQQHIALRKRLVSALLKRAGASMNVTALHLNKADELMMAAKTSAVMDFPEGFLLKIAYGMARFGKKEETAKNRRNELGELRETVIERQRYGSESHLKQNNPLVKAFDLEAVRKRGQPLTIRTRREGDFIVPLGMTGRKKLQDYFVDKKIKRDERDQVPLVALGSEILWVLGGQISENFKVKAETETILLLEYKPNI